jgi:ATP-dependent DNA ligase
MLATLTKERFSRAGWLFEPKLDGERCLAFHAQIGFTEWTAGDKLRHPRFLGLREDKRPAEVVREG